MFFLSRLIFTIPQHLPLQMTIFSVLPTLVLFTLLSVSAMPSHYTRQENENPAVGGSPDTGWEWMPDVQDASKYPSWIVTSDDGAVATMVRFLFR